MYKQLITILIKVPMEVSYSICCNRLEDLKIVKSLSSNTLLMAHAEDLCVLCD